MTATITVLLIRCAQTEHELDGGERQLTDSQINDELKAYIANQSDVGEGSLTASIDPATTRSGLERAQQCLKTVLDALSSSERKIALFTAPNCSCASTALMMTTAGVMDHEQHLTWRLTTLEGASPPAAIPIVVSNGLCNADPNVKVLGGHYAACKAGVFRCAAMPFNDGRTKCPLMEVFKRMKEKSREWLEADLGQDRVSHAQFFRITNEKNPWSLTAMSEKVNLLIDYIEPKRYMLPPRVGMFDPKKHFTEWKEGVESHIRQAAWWARQAGCDTCILVVTAACMKEMVHTVGDVRLSNIPPCSLSCLEATVDEYASDSLDLYWKFHGFVPDINRSGGAQAVPLPPFAGRISSLTRPPAGRDPNAAPKNKWSAFPEPQPEAIPADYPDLPDFGQALEKPPPPRTPKVSPAKPR